MARARTASKLVVVLAIAAAGTLGVAPLNADADTDLEGSPTSSTTTSTTTSATTSTTATSSTSSLPTTTTTTSPTTTTTTAPADPTPEAVSAITVTPDTNLGYAQDVAVHGTGFSPNVQVAFVECETGQTGAEGCDLNTLHYAVTDASGEFSGTIRVRRFMHNSVSGTIDCATAADTCRIGSGRTDGSEGATAPLTFDPTAPIPPPPTIAVDLNPIGGISVPLGVTGSGFEPDAFVEFLECKHASTDRDDCAHLGAFTSADASGNFFTGLTVLRAINTPNQLLVDCFDPPGCDLVAMMQSDPDRPGVTPLVFSGAIPLPPGLDVTVTPDTDLADNQIVHVTVTGLNPGQPVQVAECPAGKGLTEACWQPQYLVGDQSGSAETAIRLQREIGADASPIDCADPGACDIVALGMSYLVGVAPLDFDPAAAPVPDPTLTVVPDTDLVHKQPVQVAGAGFLPGTYVAILECTPTLDCGFSDGGRAFAEVQPDGTISASLSAQRGIRIGDGSLVDCVDPPGCVLFAIEQIEDGARVNAPIAFNASVPPPPAPVIELDPPGPFADHQVVQLTSSGFTPGDQVNVLQCAGAGVPPFQCRGLRYLTVPEDGTVRAGVRVQRFIEVFSDASAQDGAVTPAAAVDCAEADACTLVVFSFNDAFGLGTTPLLIDPNAPAVPPPSLVVEPSTNLEDGQVVAVHGSGFTPGGTVYMVECRADSSDQTGRACDLQKAQKSLNAGNDGTFDTTFTVRRTLNTQLYGNVDCATVAEGCILGFGGASDLQFERGNVLLHFAGDDDAPGGLPRTGSDTLRFAAWGVLALAAGVVLRVASRRRRAHDVLAE